MWRSLLERHWWALPTLSGLLLVLSFHPFNIWPLCFVALVPLYYMVLAYKGSYWQVWWGGFVTGSLFALSLSYFTVTQFQWVPEAYLFTALVHLSFIPIALVGGLLCGASCVIFRLLSNDSFLLTSLLGAAAYTLSEMLLYAVSGGYYFAMLAYAATPVVPLMDIAAFGGAFGVSFAIALVNSFLALMLVHVPARGLGSLYRGALGFLGVVVVAAAGYSYLHSGPPPTQNFAVAIIQASSRDAVDFGAEQGDVFSSPALQALLLQAAEGHPDLVVYPFSLVEGALYAGEKPQLNKSVLVASEESVGTWLGSFMPASSTVMTWSTLYEDGAFLNDFEFWQDGVLAARYQKRKLFPFIDYTPLWAQRLGFYSTSVDTVPGEEGDGLVHFGNAVATGILCSEIHMQPLARAAAFDSQFLLSAGSEAIFTDSVASNFSLKAAQLRAAENGMPAIRANLLGPSGIIAADGSFIAWMDAGESGVLRGAAPLSEPRPTFFSRWGNAPVALLLFFIGAAALARRYKNWHYGRYARK